MPVLSQQKNTKAKAMAAVVVYLLLPLIKHLTIRKLDIHARKTEMILLGCCCLNFIITFEQI